ncbi:hypothetical protein NPIL_481301, partial [Nephila pilipes]
MKKSISKTTVTRLCCKMEVVRVISKYQLPESNRYERYVSYNGDSDAKMFLSIAAHEPSGENNPVIKLEC